jgi:hypothetical protein
MGRSDQIRYELNVSSDLEAELGYEFQLDGYYFTQTGSPSASYRCFSDYPFYGHDQYFKKMSLKYDGEVLQLKGDGLDRRDFWCKYYHKGRLQYEEAKIVYPEFDASKLKKI